jgi:hypothetical protein
MNTAAKVILTVFALLGMILMWAIISRAETVEWASWQVYTPSVSSATVAGSVGSIPVTLAGPLTLAPQLNNIGTFYWGNTPTSYRFPPAVENSPSTADVIRLTSAGAYTITFAQPVTNPVMTLLSLGGSALVPITLDFLAQPVVLLATGTGTFGFGGPLTVSGNTVVGLETNGLIQFPGTMTTLMFTMNPGENWSGLTVGIPGPSAPPPPPIAMVNVHFTLMWERGVHPDPTVISVADGFYLYRAQGALCDAPDPLPVTTKHADTPETTSPSPEYIDTAAIEQVAGPLCYEVSAYNLAGESAHSNRAIVLLDATVPAPPTGVLITNLVGL